MLRNAAKLAAITLLAPLDGLLAQSDSTSGEAPVGAVVVELDSALLRDGRGLTLAQFLGTRVPGLRLEYASGYSRATARVVAVGAVGLSGIAEPLLVVDGVLLPTELQTFTGTHAQFAPSTGWGLLVDDIASIRVALGAGASEGISGAARGAVFVELKRGRGAERGVEASVVHRTVSPEAFGGVNEGTLSTAGTPSFCTRWRQVTTGCVPTGRVSFDPSTALPRIRSGSAVEAHVANNASFRGLPLRASARTTASSGIFQHDNLDRTDLRLAVGSATGALTSWDLSAAHSRLDGREAGWDADFAAPPIAMTNAGAEDTPAARANLDAQHRFYASRAMPSQTSRTHASIRASRALRSSLSLRGLAGFSNGDRTGYLRRDAATDSAQLRRTFEARNLEIGFGADHALAAWRGLRVESSVDAHWLRSIQTERKRDRYVQLFMGVPFASYEFASTVGDLQATQLHAQSRITRGNWASASLGLRKLLLNGVESGDVLKMADVAVRIPESDATAGWIDNVVVRGSYGEDLDLRAPFDAMQLGIFIGPDRSTERTLSVSGVLLGRARLSVNRSRTTVTDATLFRTAFGDTVPMLFNGLGVDARTVALSIESRPEASRPWTLDASASHRSARLDRFSFLPTFSADYFGPLLQRWHGDAVVGTLWATTYTYADANSDNVITPAEVVAGPMASIGRTDAPWVYTLRGEITPLRGFRVGGALEARRGHVAIDGAAYRRCNIGLCAPLHDAGATIEEQAKAVAAYAYDTPIDFAHSADFVKLREVWLELPSGRVPGVAGRVSIRIIGTNLMTWTTFPGDPETGARMNGVPVGFLYRSPSLPRTFSLRVDIGG